MADGTKIEWTDATVNAVNGCSVVSPGCTNCYAMRLAGTRLQHHPSRAGLTQPSKAGPVWTGEVRLNEKALLEPLRWRRPRRIFWNAHGDLFHPNVPDEWIDRVFAVCALTPQHQHQILTKRPERMREYFSKVRHEGGLCDSMAVIWERALDLGSSVATLEHYRPHLQVLPNVWLGTSVEDQARADERIPHLLATPAAVRFLSCEPLLGPVSIVDAMWAGGELPADNLGASLDWIIVGGESGPGARPMHPDWARSLRDQCAAAGVPFFFKQWGAWGEAHMIERLGTHWLTPDGRLTPAHEALPAPADIMVRRVGKKAAGRLLDGVEHNGMPPAGLSYSLPQPSIQETNA
jgi:protein gp37